MDRTGEQQGDEQEARERAIALLKATHTFPCSYSLTVIALNQEATTEAVRKVASGGTDGPSSDVEFTEVAIARYESRASSGGKYLSHRFDVRVSGADEVLDLYARLRALDGVVTLL